MAIERAFVSLLVADLAASRDFYTSLLGWEVGFDSDWFVHLVAPGSPQVQLGLFERNHALIPESARGAAPSGVVFTIVVDDVEAVFQACMERGVPVVQPPQDTFYGQRRLLITDPDGTLVDVSAPVSSL